MYTAVPGKNKGITVVRIEDTQQTAKPACAKPACAKPTAKPASKAEIRGTLQMSCKGGVASREIRWIFSREEEGTYPEVRGKEHRKCQRRHFNRRTIGVPR